MMTLPVVELDKIHSTEGGEDMPPPDAPGPIIPAYAPDKETRAATEVLKMLQKQQPTASLPKSSSLSTPPGEADYLKGGGANGDCSTIFEKAEKAQCTCLPTAYTRHQQV